VRTATAQRLAEDKTEQPSKLLASVLPDPEDCEHLTVLHVGPALQDTLDFFSQYRCQLHVRDLFAELPLPDDEDDPTATVAALDHALQFPAEVHFDLCLFWDWFSYLDAKSLVTFLSLLQPHLHRHTQAHAFGVHNWRSSPTQYLYGVQDRASLNTRFRSTTLPGYSPHSQRELKELLYCLDVERSVLLPDSRLELILRTVEPEAAKRRFRQLGQL